MVEAATRMETWPAAKLSGSRLAGQLRQYNASINQCKSSCSGSEALQLQVKTLWTAQVFNPTNWCTLEPHQINQKKVTAPEKHVLKPQPWHVAMFQADHSLEQRGKKRGCAISEKWKVSRLTVQLQSKKQRGQSQRQAVYSCGHKVRTTFWKSWRKSDLTS